VLKTSFYVIEIGGAQIAHLRAYWIRISSMIIESFSNKFLRKEKRETHPSQFTFVNFRAKLN